MTGIVNINATCHAFRPHDIPENVDAIKYHVTGSAVTEMNLTSVQNNLLVKSGDNRCIAEQHDQNAANAMLKAKYRDSGVGRRNMAYVPNPMESTMDAAKGRMMCGDTASIHW